jgi:hypothetical protein
VEDARAGKGWQIDDVAKGAKRPDGWRIGRSRCASGGCAVQVGERLPDDYLLEVRLVGDTTPGRGTLDNLDLLAAPTKVDANLASFPGNVPLGLFDHSVGMACRFFVQLKLS